MAYASGIVRTAILAGDGGRTGYCIEANMKNVT